MHITLFKKLSMFHGIKYGVTSPGSGTPPVALSKAKCEAASAKARLRADDATDGAEEASEGERRRRNARGGFVSLRPVPAGAAGVVQPHSYGAGVDNSSS